MHVFQGVPFCAGLDSLCNDSDVYTVSGLGEGVDQKLVIFFPVDAVCVAAIYFEITYLDIAQVAERIESAAKMVQTAVTAECAKSFYEIARFLYIDQGTVFRKLY